MLLKLPCSIFHLSSFIFHLSSFLYVFSAVCFLCCMFLFPCFLQLRCVSVFCRCLCRCCGRRVCAKRWVCVSVVCLSELQKLTRWQTLHWKPPKRWNFVAIKCVKIGLKVPNSNPKCFCVCQNWCQMSQFSPKGVICSPKGWSRKCEIAKVRKCEIAVFLILVVANYVRQLLVVKVRFAQIQLLR